MMKKHFSPSGISEYAETDVQPLAQKKAARKVLSILLAHIYYSRVMENGEHV
jgi:hypothetical protein